MITTALRRLPSSIRWASEAWAGRPEPPARLLRAGPAARVVGGLQLVSCEGSPDAGADAGEDLGTSSSLGGGDTLRHARPSGRSSAACMTSFVPSVRFLLKAGDPVPECRARSS